MRTILLVIFIVFLLFMAGCVRSLHPLYTDNDLVFERGLLGTWAEEKNSKDSWIFQKAGENAYDLIHTEKGTSARFEAHLVRLGEFLFLDIFPEPPDTKNEFYKFHLIQAHTFSRIWIHGDVVRLSMLDNDWLWDMISHNKVSIRHERVDHGVILTASTEELQKFVVTYANDTLAFPQPSELSRIQQ